MKQFFLMLASILVGACASCPTPAKVPEPTKATKPQPLRLCSEGEKEKDDDPETWNCFSIERDESGNITAALVFIPDGLYNSEIYEKIFPRLNQNLELSVRSKGYWCDFFIDMGKEDYDKYSVGGLKASCWKKR